VPTCDDPAGLRKACFEIRTRKWRWLHRHEDQVQEVADTIVHAYTVEWVGACVQIRGYLVGEREARYRLSRGQADRVEVEREH